jgi:hypothetical protein
LEGQETQSSETKLEKINRALSSSKQGDDTRRDIVVPGESIVLACDAGVHHEDDLEPKEDDSTRMLVIYFNLNLAKFPPLLKDPCDLTVLRESAHYLQLVGSTSKYMVVIAPQGALHNHYFESVTANTQEREHGFETTWQH